jgi:hypothetical protein
MEPEFGAADVERPIPCLVWTKPVVDDGKPHADRSSFFQNDQIPARSRCLDHGNVDHRLTLKA